MQNSNILKTLLAALFNVLLATAAAADYVGGWYVNDNPLDSEVLDLGDNSDNSYLRLRGTRGWCGSPGASYATMRSTITSNAYGSGQVYWWIDADCGNTVRVCAEGNRGQVACSTYRWGGWWWD